MRSSLENTTLSHSNTLQNYCFSASLKQYRIKAKKVGSDTYFCPYSPSPWASYLNSLRFTLFIYNLRMITLTMEQKETYSVYNRSISEDPEDAMRHVTCLSQWNLMFSSCLKNQILLPLSPEKDIFDSSAIFWLY